MAATPPASTERSPSCPGRYPFALALSRGHTLGSWHRTQSSSSSNSVHPQLEQTFFASLVAGLGIGRLRPPPLYRCQAVASARPFGQTFRSLSRAWLFCSRPPDTRGHLLHPKPAPVRYLADPIRDKPASCVWRCPSKRNNSPQPKPSICRVRQGP